MMAYATRTVFMHETVNRRSVATRIVDTGTLVDVIEVYDRLPLVRIALPGTLFEQDVTPSSIIPA